jgi:GNAT superfamily N-acetyltransferase
VTTIRSAQYAEADTLAATLANAFGEDPLFRWVTGAESGESIEPKLRVMFGALAKQELRGDDHLVFTSDDRLGVAVWVHPNQWKMSALTTLKVLPAMVRALGTKTPRMIGVFNAVEKVHPEQEHYFLEALGTARQMQGKGLGSALISPMLDRCDAEGMPAYLESSNPQNIPFYARHGFQPTGEIAVGNGAPTVTAMWRDPR